MKTWTSISCSLFEQFFLQWTSKSLDVNKSNIKNDLKIVLLAFRVNEKENGYRGICFLEREIETFALSELNSNIFHPIINWIETVNLPLVSGETELPA